jgi:hypothetical protein
MSAFNQLIDYYLSHGRLDMLAEDLETHAQHGIAYLSPELCILARPVDGFKPDQGIIDIQSIHLTYNVNTWHIHVATGNLSHCLDVMPYPLPYVSFQRNGGRLKRYNLKSLTRHGIFKQAKDTA